MMDDESKSKVLNRIIFLTKFARELENFAKNYKIDVKNEKIYIAACAQRQILQDLIDNKFY